MCGIVACLGTQPAAPVLIEGLTRLEHRGYDSAGIAVLGRTGLRVVKRAGRVRDLADSLPKRFAGKIGIGHTRWATHGAANDANAHPHTDAEGRVAVVHNGIIDNAASLRSELADAGIDLASDTDTEVLAHLVALSDEDTLEAKVAEALSRIEGTYGVAVHARRTSPTGSWWPATAARSSSGWVTTRCTSPRISQRWSATPPPSRYLDDGEMATVTATGFTTYRLERGVRWPRPSTPPRRWTSTRASYDAGEHENFMHKEMLEQPPAPRPGMRGRLDERFGTSHLGGLNLDPRELRAIRRVKILGCGSAYYVGQMGAGLIEELARIPADAEAASEFRYRNPMIEPDTLYVAVSQSGETVDTLLAVQEIRRKGGRVIGLVNVVGSAIAREVDGGIYLHAGPEVAVASTKALTNMFCGFAMLALQLGRVRDLSIADGKRLIEGLIALPGQLTEVLDDEERLHRCCEASSQGRRACSSSAGCAGSRWRARARRSSRRSAIVMRRRTRHPSSSMVRWR